MIEKPKLVGVGDFDGTVTDSFAEGKDYFPAFIQAAAEMVGVPAQLFMDTAEGVRREVLAAPHLHAWKFDGYLIAPGTVDPYVTANTVAKATAIKLGKVLTDEQAYACFKKCYVYATATVFKPEAQEFIEYMHNNHKFTFVTNSDETAVLRKLETLFGRPDHGIQVVGGAKKYAIDETWTEMPFSVKHRGFPRQVLLQRREYDNKLQKIAQAYGAIDFVAGDIYELDLALPERRGIFTVLVTSEHSLPHEIAYYEKHKKGFHTDSLTEITDRIRQGRIRKRKVIFSRN